MTTSTDKQYSFASVTRLAGKGSIGKVNGNDVFLANATVQGFIANDPEVREMADGRKVLNISVPLNNTGKKITGSVGINEKADETLWVRATIFDSEQVPSATRAAKVLKKGMLVVLNGVIKTEEYNGKAQFNMTVNDFKISWSKEKGQTVGGQYSYVSARKADKDGTAVVAFEGFIGNDPEVRTTTNGTEVLSVRVGLNKVGNKLNYPLGIQEKTDDVTWIQVNVWDNDGFPLKSRAEKILKKGMAIIGHGLMTAKAGDKGYFYNLNLSDFEIARGLGEGKEKTESFNEETVSEKVSLDETVPF